MRLTLDTHVRDDRARAYYDAVPLREKNELAARQDSLRSRQGSEADLYFRIESLKDGDGSGQVACNDPVGRNGNTGMSGQSREYQNH